MFKKLDDNVLNFISGGLYTNSRKLEKKKLDIFLKNQKNEGNEIVKDKKLNNK